MAEQRPFGRRGTEPGSGPPQRPRVRASEEQSILPDGAAMVARTRKRTIGVSLATAGALTAAGLWFAESGERRCVDDPATPMVDESKVGDCATSGSRSHGGSWVGRWFWRGGSSSSSAYWGGSSSSGSYARSSSSTPVATKSSASRGGFGSLGSFHMFGGS